MRRVLCAGVVLGLNASALCYVPVQWLVADGGNGHVYQAFRPTFFISWVQAQAQAVALGGYLATPSTQEENDWLYTHVAYDPSLWVFGESFVDGPWLGGIQEPNNLPAEGWSWVSGEPWNFTNWAPGQPDDYHGDTQDALHLWGGPQPGGAPTNMWDDVGRTRTMPSYIVEWVPEPTALLMLAALGAGLRRR